MSGDPSNETAGGLDDQVGGPQTSDQEILDRLLQGKEYRETFVLESDEGNLEIDLTPIDDREQRYEYMSALPSGWFDAAQKGDPEEVDDFGSLIPDGKGIKALHEMVIESAESASLTQSDIELLVKKRFSDGALTKAGLQVLQMSTEHNTDISGFRSKE